MNIASTIRGVKSVITANSPVLLVGTAVAGVVTTGVLAAKGGYKARGIIDAAQAEKPEEPLKLQEKVQLTWLCYAAPGVTGLSTIASIVGVHTVHTKRHAALAGLYAVTTSKLDDYREQAEELLGSKKSQQVNDGVAQKAIDKNPVENHEVIITGGGSELFYDDWSGRYLYSSMPEIEKAFHIINMQLLEAGDAALNDFYEAIGLPPIPMGMTFGWSGTKLEPRWGSVKTTDGRSAVSFWFHQEPKDNLGAPR